MTQYEYNPRSNVTAVVDALSQHYEFVYDALSRVTSATRAGMMMSFAYDAVSNRIQRTDYNNLTSSYAYDALKRLTTITYPDTSTATYSYDALSQLKTATNLNGTVSFVYDSLGRATSTTDVWGQVLNYTYDANDRRTKLSFGATTNATYTYDVLNRLTKITDSGNLAVTYAYDAASRLTSRALPNGVTTTYSYDDLDRLTKLKDAKQNTVIADNNYQYNSAGNITQNIDQSGTHSYGYDVLDRLTAATYTGTPNESYAYDGVGNRTTSHRSATYGYQPFNRLTATSTASYLYDNNGNMTTKTEGTGTTQFAWDFENRLTQVVTPASGSASYKYDALGRRIQRAPSSGVSSNFSYDGQDVVKDTNSDGSTVEYLNGPGIDNKIRQKGSSTSTTYYFSQDHLGSTAALTGTTGKLVERTTYDAYGDSSGSTKTRYGFTGRERDSLTGMLYYRARWYDAQLGRFISEDPIGFEGGGANLYAYVENSPVVDIDPEGLQRGRGPGHSVSVKRNPREWLERFKGRRQRNKGDSPGHDEQLRTRCRELEKWLFSLTMVDMSEADLHRELMNQYDWCRKRFPKTCKGPSPSPSRVPEGSPAPNPAPNQNRGWIDDGIPRWDDGTPLDPAKYPEAYERARARRAGQIYIFPINPLMPSLMPGTVPIRVPIFAW